MDGMKMMRIGNDIVNLNNITYIESRAFGGYLIHFTGGDSLVLNTKNYKALCEMF